MAKSQGRQNKTNDRAVMSGWGGNTQQDEEQAWRNLRRRFNEEDAEPYLASVKRAIIADRLIN